MKKLIPFVVLMTLSVCGYAQSNKPELGTSGKVIGTDSAAVQMPELSSGEKINAHNPSKTGDSQPSTPVLSEASKPKDE